MDKFILPPPPNWFLSNILACNGDGILAYGSRTELAIVKFKTDGNFKVSIIAFCHNESLNAVVFAPKDGNFNCCLATCADDGMVRVWDFTNSSLLMCHSGHKDGVKVTGLDWSRNDTNRLVSVNDLGSIVVWDLPSNSIRKLHCNVKVLPLCLSCCPHDKDLIAIGCKAGITLVFEIKGNGKLIHRLRVHDQDIISTSWCPVSYSVIRYKRTDVPSSGGGTNKENIDKPKDLLLATGGGDQSIYIWRAGSDGRYEAVLYSSTSSSTKNLPRKKVSPMNAPLQWTCVLWVDAYTLLSSNQFGELLSWNLNNLYPEKSKKLQPRILHSNHNKGCFSIACPIIYDRVEEWKSDMRIVWTTAMDKHIIACSLVSSNILLDIPTAGGAVYCMAFSPLDPSRMAFGSSDKKISIWNINDFSAMNITTYWKKIIGKVMALRWHPTEENWLAFGTSEGHVGLLELGSNKVPTLFRLHHRKAVYRLCWAPPLINASGGSENGKAVLYSLGDGDVFQYAVNFKQPDEEPKSLNVEVLHNIESSQGPQKQPFRSDMEFKHDLSCFAIASENGFVHVVNCQSLTVQHAIFAQKKLINSLKWHPQTVASDNNISPNKDWLAIASESIKVYNLPLDRPAKLLANLTGHSMKIVCIDWSPHFNGRLLSSSYDCTVQLWDVPRQTCMGIYQAHNSAVTSTLFNPLDPDLAISGSLDNTLRFWSLSELSLSSDIGKTRKSLRQIASNARAEVTEATELTTDAEQNYSRASGSNICKTWSQHPKKGKENSKSLANQTLFRLTEPSLLQAKHFDVLLQRFMSPEPPNHAHSSVEDQNKQGESSSASELGYLDLFGDSTAIQRRLFVEEKNLADLRQFPLAYNTALWHGDVSSMIQEATSKKQLSPWLISMAPIAGFDVWEQACDAYANQLMEQDDVLNASSYLLATHKVHEAVRLLKDKNMYIDAAAVAKCRLPADDPLINEVYTEWANWSKHRGNLKLAAHCYLAANNIEDCITVLARGKDLKSLRMAVLLAKHTSRTDTANSLAIECLTMCVKVCNQTVGQQLLVEMPQFQYWDVWLKACEVLSRVKNRTEVEVFGWLEGHRPGQSTLLHDLNAICTSRGSVYQQLIHHLPTNKTPDFDRDMWFYVSGHLAVACAAKLESSMANFLRHMVSAFSAAFHFQTINPQSLALPIIISQIVPTGLFAEDSILLAKYELNEEKLLLKSLKAFVCASIIHWMNNNWEKVEKLLSKEKPSVEIGDGDYSKQHRDYKMSWLVELFLNCTADVLDPESVSFFVKKAEKLQLESLVVQENIQQKCLDNKHKNHKVKNKTLKIKTYEGLKNSYDYNVSDSVSKQIKEVDKGLKVAHQSIMVETDAQKATDQNVAIIADVSGKVSKLEVTTYEVDYLLQPSNLSVDKVVETDTHSRIYSNVAVIGSVSETAVKVEEATYKVEPSMPQSSSSIEITGDPEKHSNLNTKNVSSNKREMNFLELNSDSKNNLSKSDSNGTNVDNKGSDPSAVKPDANRDVSTEHDSDSNKVVNFISKTEEIKSLDRVLMMFESERVSAPSPFTAYMNIKYLIDNIVSKQDAKVAQNLQHNCDCVWKKSHR